MSDKVLIKTSKKINGDKEKVSVISYRYDDKTEGFEVYKSSLPTRDNIDTHKAELFINPNTKELFYEYTMKTQEELNAEII